MTGARFHQAILDSAPLGFVALRLAEPRDPDERLTLIYANRAASSLIGVDLDRCIGKTAREAFPWIPAQSLRAYAQVCRTREPRPIGPIVLPAERGGTTLNAGAFPGPEGSVVIVFESADQPFCGDQTEWKRAQEVLRASHDELERRVAQRTDELQLEIAQRFRAEEALQRAEEQLRQAQKMEAIGRLAGGIAHDFNNLLSVVLSYCDLMLDRAGPESAFRVDLEEVRRAGERAATLTRQLLAFSRQQVLLPRVLDLNDVIRGMRRMLERLLGEDVEMELRCAPRLQPVRVDPAQIEQVVMNLVINARDAMPTGGKITLETQDVDLDEEFAAAHLGVTAGPHVMLAVSDTGFGMDGETMARIFEPFFTTKDRGKGTGLGLSTAFGIVKQSAGSIWVYSEPGKGATFKVYLPVTREAPSALPPPASSPGLAGRETVLLVEDEDQVRALAASILRKFGYRVLEARRPREAIALAEEETGPIQMLLTDVVMPEMAGPILARRIAAMRPGTRMLFMSGYTDEAIVRHGILEAGAPFLQKPFVPEALARRVREVLDAAPPSRPS